MGAVLDVRRSKCKHAFILGRARLRAESVGSFVREEPKRWPSLDIFAPWSIRCPSAYGSLLATSGSTPVLDAFEIDRARVRLLRILQLAVHVFRSDFQHVLYVLVKHAYGRLPCRVQARRKQI